jgi:nucleotide-binding universal stress UspA family protein
MAAPALPTAVLCATDLSGRCDRALDRAALLAGRWNVRLVVVHALETSVEFVDARRLRDLPSWRRPADRAKVVAGQLRAELGELMRDATVVVEEADPAELIERVCLDHPSSLIVTGVARNELFGRRFLGTTVDALLRRVAAPVLVVRERARQPYSRIAVATDFSDASRHALETAAILFPDTDVVLFHAFKVMTGGIVDRGQMRDGWRTMVEQDMAALIKAAAMPEETKGRLRTILEEGDPERLLRDYVVAKNVELVVTGSRGQVLALELLLGNTAKRLIEGLTCDVLAVRDAR